MFEITGEDQNCASIPICTVVLFANREKPSSKDHLHQVELRMAPNNLVSLSGVATAISTLSLFQARPSQQTDPFHFFSISICSCYVAMGVRLSLKLARPCHVARLCKVVRVK